MKFGLNISRLMTTGTIIAMVILFAAPIIYGAIKCAHCGKEINGPYLEYNGHNYHRDCFTRHVALRCDLCGEIINGEYIVDYWGNKYHKHHERTALQCEYCGRLISEKSSKGGQVYPDGRRVCGYCLRSAVNDISTARRIMKDVKGKLKKAGINIENGAIKLKLVDRNGLRHISWSGHADESGLTKYTEQSLDGVFIVRDFEIYILDGLPRVLFTEVMAHELMHVWLYTNSPKNLNLQLAEGSCNYASFLIVSKLYGEMAEFETRNLLENPDQVYGDGFRRVKRMVSDKGIAAWLDFLKSNIDFAQGY